MLIYQMEIYLQSYSTHVFIILQIDLSLYLLHHLHLQFRTFIFVQIYRFHKGPPLSDGLVALQVLGDMIH